MRQKEERRKKKRERGGIKPERKWSAASLANENDCVCPLPKKYLGKTKGERKRKKIPMATAKKRLAMILKRLYGYIVFPEGECSKESESDGSPPEESPEYEEEETSSSTTPPRIERKPLEILLEKLYGYVIMSSMVDAFNKLEWKSSESDDRSASDEKGDSKNS